MINIFLKRIFNLYYALFKHILFWFQNSILQNEIMKKFFFILKQLKEIVSKKKKLFMINIFWKRIFNLFMPYFKNCKKKYKYIFLHFL